MSIQNSNRIFGLDLMRAIAILMVLSSHTLSLFDAPRFKGIDLLYFFGFFGVEIFFVLSGFLIGNILYKAYMKSDFSFSEMKNFWMRRWLRTLPNYFLALMINLLLAFFLWESVPERIWTYFVFLQNIKTQPLFFNESWSLSIEEYAYLLFPIFLFFFVKIKDRRKSFLFVVILFLVSFFLAKCFYHYSFSVAEMNYWNLNLKSVLVYRIDAIVYGVLGAWLINNFSNFFYKCRYPLLLIGFLIIGFLLFGIRFLKLSIETSSLFWDVFYLPLSSIGVLFSLPFFNSCKFSTSFFSKSIVLISKTSYSIYLFHYFIVLYLFTEFVKPYITTPLHSVFYVLGYLAATFVVSFAVYNYFEKPILKWRNNNYN